MGGVVSYVKESYVSTRIGEVFTTRKRSDNYVFRSCLIKSDFVNRLSQIDKIYKSVYQLNALKDQLKILNNKLFGQIDFSLHLLILPYYLFLQVVQLIYLI